MPCLAAALASLLCAQGHKPKIFAQRLVEIEMEKHPDLLIIAFHVTPPGEKDNIIIASNFGRIGKKGDDDDMKVINSGEPIVGVYAEGKRYGVELPLHDAANNTVGALSVGLRYGNGDNPKALLAKAERVRDELQKRIPSLDTLVELDP